MSGRFNLNDYIDVQTRINTFWKEYPGGAIRTSLASDPTDFTTCRYRAEVYKDASSERPDATGYAFEIAGTGMANKTSHEENGETSAIGRALANMGYATSAKDRPSREEMRKASSPNQQGSAPQKATQAPQRNDKAPVDMMSKTVNAAGLKKLHAVLAEHNLDHSHLTAYAIDQGHKSSKELTNGQAKKLVDGLGDKPEAVVLYLDQLKTNQEVAAQFDAQKAGSK